MIALLNRSLRYRLIAVILATTLSALLVASVALLIYEVRNYRSFLAADVETLATILASSNQAQLDFDDQETAQENLALLKNRPDILAAAIYRANGEPFALYERSGELGKPPATAPLERERFVSGVYELSFPVVVNAEIIGTVFLRASYDLAGRLQDYLLILGAVMLLSLVVAGVVSLRLQRGVTAPVLAISAVARKVIEQRDFSHRAAKTTDDEIGVLVDSFNAMLGEVARVTDALEATNRRLREETEERRSAEAALLVADRRKDEFLATLAHELRNPLAPMVNALGMVDESSLGPDARRARDIIERQLAHMVRLVDDLLDVSRITRGKLAVHIGKLDLESVITSAVDTVRPVIDARGHRLEVTLPQPPVFIEGDAVRLSQVFSNLLNNAAKYTEPGGRIALSAERVDGDFVEVAVSDDGIGMTEETLGTIFEMFTQGTDDKSSRSQAGLGVGLALAKRLVELHGGTIRAASAGLSRGSRFIVRLPACPHPDTKPIDAVDAPEDTAGRAAQPGAAARPRRILLVDDNVDFAMSLAILLETLGHEVKVAHEAEGALKAAAELEPEIAFLDIGLPQISGYELAAKLRSLPACARTTMVALSGWGQMEDRKRSREAGFADHLVKPVDLKTIENVLDGLVS